MAYGKYGGGAVGSDANGQMFANFGDLSHESAWSRGAARLTVLRTGSSAGEVRVISDLSGIDCGTDCLENYPDYTRVRLTPTTVMPIPVWRNCDLAHPDNSCEVELMSDRTVEINAP